MVYTPYNELDDVSSSRDNNYEVVDFVASRSGVYEIRLYKHSDTIESNNQLFVAWTKDATYLPKFLSERDGTDSEITIRNDGAEDLDAKLMLYHEDGSFAMQEDFAVPANGQICRDPASPSLPNGFRGSAIVSGGETLSVVLEQMHTSHRSATSGVRMLGSADPNWERIDDDMLLPHVYNGYYGYTSEIAVFNTSPLQNTVAVEYRNSSGNIVGTGDSRTLAGHETWVFSPSASAPFYGSAHIESINDIPFAASADALYSAGNVDFGYGAVNGAQDHWLPYLMKQYGGWNSCFSVRNLDTSSSATVTVDYYWDTGNHLVRNYPVSPNAVTTLCQNSDGSLPSGTRFSAWVHTTSETGLAIAVNQTNGSKNMTYASFSEGALSVVAPRLYYNWGSWDSGIMVQNVSQAGSTSVSITYYNSAGDVVQGPLSLGTIGSNRALSIYLPNHQPSGAFNGSAVISATQPIVAVANATCAGCGGDEEVYAYNGTNR